MTTNDFIKALKLQTSDSALFGTKAILEKPPGRKPHARDVALSRWYNNLTPADRESVNDAMREAAELAVFSFLCVLDGVSAIEDYPHKGNLRLIYERNGNEVCLNDPGQEFMHDIYNALCRSSDPVAPDYRGPGLYETGQSGDLRKNQNAKDGLDLHSLSP